MLFGFGILATALLLSMVAAYYSVAGLVAIFSAATIPVIIMGGSLELGKIVATVWLHNNWRRAGWAFKAYLIPAVAFLMLLTSMGIFGYLSKAHSDQSLVSGDATAKIAIYDEKIKTERDNIDANRKALKQLDEAVDQVMGRSTTETGAERAVQIRRSQQAERGRLLKEIGESQKRITTLNEERAPLAAEFRKVEAEVGPIKYIAALVYGDSADTNVLEKAVRFVIIMIVLVFDPLALTLILAANKQFEWARKGRGGWAHDDEEKEFQEALDQKRAVAQALDAEEPLPVPPEDITTQEVSTPVDTVINEQTHPYLYKGDFWKKPEGWVEIGPLVAKPETEDLAELDATSDAEKEAMRAWKAQNPTDSLKAQRDKLQRGEIDQLPWLGLVADNEQPRGTTTGFGTAFPDKAAKGDSFVRVDYMPNRVYKYNGNDWILIDKNISDNYTHDIAYIDHLIAKIASGEYDPELLNDTERDQVAARIKQTQA